MDPTTTKTTARLFAGVDVSKDRLDICLRWSEPQGHDEGGEEAFFVVAYDETGIEALTSRLLAERTVLVIVEATGGFERAVVGALAAAGLPLAVVNPRQVRDFARATGKLAKTDRIDAGILARFAEAVRPAPKPHPNREIRALQTIVARRRQLLGMLAAENNRLSSATKPVAKRIKAHLRWLEKDSPAPSAIWRRRSRAAQPWARTRRSCGACQEWARYWPAPCSGRSARAGHAHAQATRCLGGGRPSKPRLGHSAWPS